MDGLLELPELEDALRYPILWFYQVKGPEPLSYVEIDAWARLTHSYPSPQEVELLMALDTDYLTVESADSWPLEDGD